MAIDVAHSNLTVAVSKQGLFSAFADNHVIDAPIASGTYDDAQKAVTLTVDATQMRVLDPKAPANRRADVQSNMAGPQVLDVNTYRTIVFRSTSITAADSTHWTVNGWWTACSGTVICGYPFCWIDQVWRTMPNQVGS